MSYSKILFLLVLCSCLIIGNAKKQQKGWRGIVPLHSTRSDVERVLGQSEGQCNCIYKTDDDFVYIEYAKGPCKGNPSGWNVPAGKVLSITVRSRIERRLSELKFDPEEYVKTQDDAFTTYYTKNREGITYEISLEGVVSAITYSPSITDNGLRCNGWPLLSVRQSFYRPSPFDNYSEISWADETGRLDNFAFHLQRQATTTGYVIVYTARQAPTGEAQSKAERIKTYLVDKRGIEAQRIVTIDGGRRKQWHVELFAIPRNAPAPYPIPGSDAHF